MADRSLDLTIISAKDLNKVNLVGKMDVYAVVYIDGATYQDQKQKTHVDNNGDSNPTWNYQMKFKIDESAALQNRLNLVVKIKTEGMFGDKDLGEVHVPVKELLEGDLSGGKPLQFVTYQVRKPSGKPKGELSFSYKFDEKIVGVVTDGKPDKMDEFVNHSAGKPEKLGEPATAYLTAGSGSSSLYPPLYAVTTGASSLSPVVTASVGGAYYPPPPAGYPAPTVTTMSATPGVGSAYYPPPAGYPQPQGANASAAPGAVYYPPPAGYPQTPMGYGYQQQPTYGDYLQPPPVGYGGYPEQTGYGYPPM